MRICVTGPIATADIGYLLRPEQLAAMPRGYVGAPLLGLLIGALLRRGHEVIAISTDDSLPLKAGAVRASHGAFSFVLVPQRRRAFRPVDGHLGRVLDLFRIERRLLCEEILAAKPEIVHAHWTYEFGWAALQTKLPHLITAHDSPIRVARVTRSVYRWIRAAMAWYVLRSASNLSAVSPYMAREIQPWVVLPIQVVPNPISEQAFRNFRVRTGLTARIAMVTNGWGALKNAAAALEAFAIVRQKNPEAELHIWGHDFGENQVAERWAEQRELSVGVFFHGVLNHENLLQQVATCDLLLHPALEESFGVVPAEALAIGLPVVAGINSGAVPWVVGSAGRLVDVKEPSLMAAALLELLADPLQMLECSEKGHADMRARFGVEGVCDQYIHRYAKIVEERQ